MLSLVKVIPNKSKAYILQRKKYVHRVSLILLNLLWQIWSGMLNAQNVRGLSAVQKSYLWL